MVGDVGVVRHVSRPAYRNAGCGRGGHRLSGRHAHCDPPHVHPHDIAFRDAFRDDDCGKDPLPEVDAHLSPGHMEYHSRRYPRYRAGHAGACDHVDVRNEPEQHKHVHSDMVHSGRNF